MAVARFSKNTISSLGGVSGQVIAEELLFGEDRYWDINITNPDENGLPVAVDVTDWVFQFRLVRRQVDRIEDGRHGIELVNLRPASGASEMYIDPNIVAVNPQAGLIRVLIDSVIFDQIKPAFNSEVTPVYTGYIGMIMPARGTYGTESYIPQMAKKILLCFIIRSDGISAQMSNIAPR
jgi:hypothetical protein